MPEEPTYTAIHNMQNTIQTCVIQFVMDDVFSVSRKSADWPHYFALFTATKID